eukprot:Pgem_evm1s16196
MIEIEHMMMIMVEDTMIEIIEMMIVEMVIVIEDTMIEVGDMIMIVIEVMMIETEFGEMIEGTI